MGSSRTHARGAVLLAGAILAAGACSAGTVTSSRAPGPSSAAVSGSAAAAGATCAPGSLGTLRVAMVTPFNLGSIALFGADKLGTFAGTGLNVQLVVATSPTADPLLATGSVDIVDESPNKPVADIAKGLQAKVMGAESLSWGQVVIASSKEHITSVSQLEGKTFGVSGFGSGGYFATLQVAQHFGWSTSQYKITQLGGLPQLVAGLKSGAIDAFIWNDEEGAVLQAEGIATDLGSVDPYIHAAGDVFVVSDKALSSHGPAIRAFFKALYAEQARLVANPTVGRDLAISDFKQNAAATDSVYSEVLGTLSTDGQIPAANLKVIGEAALLSNPDLKSVNMPSTYEYWQNLPAGPAC